MRAVTKVSRATFCISLESIQNIIICYLSNVSYNYSINFVVPEDDQFAIVVSEMAVINSFYNFYLFLVTDICENIIFMKNIRLLVTPCSMLALKIANLTITSKCLHTTI